MVDYNDIIRQELKGQDSGGDKKPERRIREKSKSRPRQSAGSDRPKAPVASERSSEVAEVWMRLAESNGYNPPFNANWLAHQITDRVAQDRSMGEYLALDRFDEVRRWLIKMAEKFWDEYVDNSVRNSDLSGFFLTECWDDVRDYAFDCLRAAYLKKYGWAIPAPDSEEFKPWHESQIHKQLKQARWNEYYARHQSATDDQVPRVDPNRTGEEIAETVRSLKDRIRARRAAREEEDEDG